MSLCSSGTSLLLSRCRWVPPRCGHRAGVEGSRTMGGRDGGNSAELHRVPAPHAFSLFLGTEKRQGPGWEACQEAGTSCICPGTIRTGMGERWDSWRWGGELGWAWMLQGRPAANSHSQCHPPATPSLPAPAQHIEFTCLSPQGIVSGHGLWLVEFVALPTSPAAPKPLAVCPTHDKYFFENLN